MKEYQYCKKCNKPLLIKTKDLCLYCLKEEEDSQSD